MAMAEEEIKQLKNEKESMVQELTKLKAKNQRVNERFEKKIKNREKLVESLDSARAENLLKSSGNAHLITKNNKLSKIVTDNEIEIERLRDEVARALDGLTAKKNECTLLNQNIQALKVECASFTKRLNDSENQIKKIWNERTRFKVTC